jgi:hypothetical protein
VGNLNLDVKAFAVPRAGWAEAFEQFGIPKGHTGPAEEMFEAVNAGWMDLGAEDTEHVAGTTSARDVFEAAQNAARRKSGTDQVWRRRLPASASDASREALNSSKQREAPPLPPDLLNLREDYLRICFQYAVQGEEHPTAIRLKVGCAVIHKSRKTNRRIRSQKRRAR